MSHNIFRKLFPGRGAGANMRNNLPDVDLPTQGIYHFERHASGERSRIHLRIDGELSSEDG